MRRWFFVRGLRWLETCGGRDISCRHRRHACRGQESIGCGPGPRPKRAQAGLRQTCRSACCVVGAVLATVRRGHPRVAHPSAILPGALLLWGRIATGRATHAAARRVVRGRGLAPAVEGRLPQRPQHPDDLHRLPHVRRFRRGRVFPRLPLELAADLSQVRPGVLRCAWRRGAGCDEPGRTTARRVGPIQSLTHDGSLERAPVLSPLAPHRRSCLSAGSRLSVLSRNRRLPACAVEARPRRPAAPAALQLAGDIRQLAPRVPQAQ